MAAEIAITTAAIGVFKKAKDLVIKSHRKYRESKAMPLEHEILLAKLYFEIDRFTAYCESAQRLLGDVDDKNIEDHPLAQSVSEMSSILVRICDELHLSWEEKLVEDATILNNGLEAQIAQVKEEMEENKGQDKQDLATAASVRKLSERLEADRVNNNINIGFLHDADAAIASRVQKLESKVEEMEDNKGQDEQDLATAASVERLLRDAEAATASRFQKLESKIEEMEEVIAEMRKQPEEKK